MLVLVSTDVFITELVRLVPLAFKASPTLRFCPKTFPLALKVTILLEPEEEEVELLDGGAVRTGMLLREVLAEGCCECVCVGYNTSNSCKI